MSVDRRYSAFLLILAVFIGFFLLTSNTFHKDPPAETKAQPALVKATGLIAPAPQASTKPSAKITLPVFPIDINKATIQELMLLPGIGEKTAKRIVEKRVELGGFKTVDDLTSVKWIGKVKLEKIRGLVTVSRHSSNK